MPADISLQLRRLLLLFIFFLFLAGGAVNVPIGVTAVCAGVYDENFVFSASICP